MQSTHLRLLSEAAAGSEQAWGRLVELYQPLVYGWLRRERVAHHDAEDLAQEVLAVVARELPGFEHCGRTGAFRRWLRLITAHRAQGFWRAGKLRPVATGETKIRELIEQLEDDTSAASRLWDREHDEHLLRQLLIAVEREVEPTTFQAFRRQVFDGVPAGQVAQELGVSVGAVYSAKSRVLRRLRQEVAGAIDTVDWL